MTSTESIGFHKVTTRALQAELAEQGNYFEVGTNVSTKLPVHVLTNGNMLLSSALAVTFFFAGECKYTGRASFIVMPSWLHAGWLNGSMKHAPAVDC